MQATVKYAGKLLTLDKKDLIGEGGEALVFGVGNDALKVYKDPTPLRAEKLRFLVSQKWNLPKDKVVLVKELLEDTNRQVIGFSMDKLGVGYSQIASLANKKFRLTNSINSEKVARIFLDGAHTLLAIHNQGINIGDFNARNAMFRGTDMVFLEPDGVQVNKYPCLVATEQFVEPSLYRVNFANQNGKLVFTNNTDWYSFAVMLFKSLLLVHPYGGVHNDITKLTERSMRKITVFNKNVVYPKIAEDPKVLNSDMRNVFDEYFLNGWRGPFPLVILENYIATLSGKPVVHTGYVIPVTSEVAVDGVIAKEIIVTNGAILFSKVVGNKFYVISNEGDYVYLYSYALGEGQKKFPILKSSDVSGGKYDIFDKYLVVNVLDDDTQKLLIFEIGSNGISFIHSTTAEEFSLNSKAMFKASSTHLYRIVGGMLMEGSFEYGQFVERVVRPINQRQTWFTVNQYHLDEKPQMFGFFQVLSDQLYWYIDNGKTYDVDLPKLLDKEVMREISVKFSSQGAMVRRVTQKDGQEYIRIEIVNSSGNVIFSKFEKRSDYRLSVHGIAYSGDKALHAMDEGLVQEDLVGNTTKTFSNTKKYLAQGFSLEKFGKDIAVVSDKQVVLLSLK